MKLTPEAMLTLSVLVILMVAIYLRCSKAIETHWFCNSVCICYRHGLPTVTFHNSLEASKKEGRRPQTRHIREERGGREEEGEEVG